MSESTDKFTWARAFRDIGVKSISSGQFPIFLPLHLAFNYFMENS